MKKRLCIFFGFIILSTTACSAKVAEKTSDTIEPTEKITQTATPTDSIVAKVEATLEPVETAKNEATVEPIETTKTEAPTVQTTHTPPTVKETTAPPEKTAKPVEPPVVKTPATAKPAEAKPVEAKPVEAKPVEVKPVVAKPVEVKPVEAPAAQKPTIEMAQKYVGSSVQSLVKALGQPNSKSYAPSCIGDGDDGELHYDGFVVYTYKEGNTETVSTIESN